MADGLLGYEGFETDDTASVWETWSVDGGAFYQDTISAGAARSGNKGFRCEGTGHLRHESWLWAPKTHVIVGFAFRNSANLDGDNGILEIRGPGDVTHVGVFITGQRTLGVNGPFGSRFLNFALDLDTWYYIEFRVKIHNSTGEIELRVNGATTGPSNLLVTGLDTCGSDNAPSQYANQFHMGAINGFLNASRDFDFDDIYVRDNETGLGFLGDVEIVGYGLQADFQNTWSRNGGATNFERLIETTPDEETTRVYTPVAGSELYEVGDTAYQGALLAVQLVVRGRKTTTHVWRLRTKTYLSGVVEYGPWYYLGFPTYETFPPAVFGRDPNGDPWTISTWNAMKVGFEAETVP